MKIPRKNPGRAAVVFLAALVLLAGCDNLQHQRNPRTLAASGHRAAADRPLPAHVVARGSPAPGDPVATGFRQGAPLAQNPLPLTRELLARGRERFDIHCAVCHGADGYGTGIVVRRGFPAPPSLHDDRLRAAADGRMFDVITRGYGVMLPAADRIAVSDRWAIVAYVRALQLSQHATLADVPDAERTELLKP